MGCANSMPLIPGSGGMVETAKNAVNDTVHAGEEALHDVGESLNGAAVSVKEAVIGAVKSIGTGVDEVKKDVHEAEQKVTETVKANVMEHVIPNDENGEPLFKTIPLKDLNTDDLDDNFDEFKDMLSKMDQQESINSEINKTSMNVVNAVETVEKDVATKIDESIQEFTEMVIADKTPTHSLDSLKTSTPEPEIINAMLNDTYKSAPSPKPTLAEMKSIEEMDEILNDMKL